MKIRILTLLATLVAGFAAAAVQMEVYVIDVEGGKSVLLISPAGQTMLIDAGWPASGSRAASVDAIAAVAQAAGVKQIDHLVISHFDADHMGDVPQLASKLPVRHIYDHGEFQSNPSLDDAKYKNMVRGAEERFKPYDELRRKVGHTVVKPGEKIPFKDVDVQVLSAGGKTIEKPVAGRGTPNPECAKYPLQPRIERDVEDNLSVGLLFTLGKFRMLDLADLEAYVTRSLVCPNNLIGSVDVYNVNVHGQFKGIAPELVNAIHARVMLLGNGSRKGGDPQSWPILHAAPGLEDIWQAHFTIAGGALANASENMIANVDADQHGNWIKVEADPDGSFTVTNSRNHLSKTYKARN
jgi:competence protein ComEC